MPGLGATDPADLQAHARTLLGLSWQLQQTRPVTPHPSYGGGGYNVWFREEQLVRAQAGEDANVFDSSLRCWGQRLHTYRQTGNKVQGQVVGVTWLPITE